MRELQSYVRLGCVFRWSVTNILQLRSGLGTGFSWEDATGFGGIAELESSVEQK